MPADADFLIRHIYGQTVLSERANYVEMADRLKEKDLDLYNGELSFQGTGKGWEKAA